MNLRLECPICKSQSIATFLRRLQTPVHQNLVVAAEGEAQNIGRGDLTLGCCEACGFVFNQTFDLAKLSYGENYDNTQTFSATFNDHIEGLIQYLLDEKSVRNCRIVEVGCGQGLFLRRLVAADESGNRGYGFDPSYRGPEVDLNGRLIFEKRFYGPECAHIPADVVICRHVIEHVPEPVELLRAIRQVLINSLRARVFFETPCVEWILRNCVAWDFFYEHCSYFTSESLTTAFEVAGFQVEDVRHIFGGQYLWLEAVPAAKMKAANIHAGSILHLVRRFAEVEGELLYRWRAQVQRLAANQSLALWGAGAKGVTFANLVDPNRTWIKCVVDLNPNKQGHCIPGTGHPIIDYHDLKKWGVATAILMNPNYGAENLELLREAALDVNLIAVGE